MQKAIQDKLLAALDVKLTEINALASEVSSLLDMTNKDFPRDEKLWKSVEKAAGKKRFTGSAVMFKKYKETVEGSFEERVALMLLQVLEIAHKHNVDLKFMIQTIANYRISKIHGKH